MVTSTRDLLVVAAADLLDAGGLDAVTLREVSRRAGVSHNAPYKHFADKEALLAAVAAKELTRQGNALAALAAERSSPEDVVRSALQEYLRWALGYPARFRLVFGVWNTPSMELGVAADATRSVLLRCVRSAQEAGSLPDGDAERLTVLLQALIHGAAELALIGHLMPGGKGNASPEQLVDDVLRYLRVAATAEATGAERSA